MHLKTSPGRRPGQMHETPSSCVSISRAESDTLHRKFISGFRGLILLVKCGSVLSLSVTVTLLDPGEAPLHH